MSGLLPLLIALALVEATGGPGATPQESPWWALGTVIGGVAVMEILARVAGRLPRRHLDRWDLGVQGLILGIFTLLCFLAGWSRWAPSPTVALVPWFLLQAAWWAAFPAVLPESGWTRRGHLLHQLRFGLLPLALLLPIADLCDTIGRALAIDVWIDRHLGRGANMAGSFLLMAGILVVLPAVLVRLWGARPLADPDLRQDLEEVCRRLGVPVAGILAWPVAGGRVHNAAVMGLLPRLRWVLITEDLLADAGRAGVRAVLGHELGHARHRHLLVYLLFAAAAGMAGWWASYLVLAVLEAWPWAQVVAPEVRQAAVAILILAILWRGLFGVVSRICERQADLAGVEATGDHRDLCHALLVVARGAGVDPRAPSWRHFSIADRIAFVEAAAADPGMARAHHRKVRWLVAILALVTALLAATLLATPTFGLPARPL